jgi:hypothetical protein
MRHIIAFFVLLASATDSCTSVQNTPSTPPKPPFQLTHEEQQNVDRLLARWEQWNAGAKTFDCRFKRWDYDNLFRPKNEQRLVELGSIKYVAPDRCLYKVNITEKDGRELPIDDMRAEHWAFDGKSIIEVNSLRRQVIEHRLPPGLGSKLLDGPLTFSSFPTGLFSFMFGISATAGPFGTKAKDLKEQYYLREVTPANRRDQIWLEAYPRSSQSVYWCKRLQLIFLAKDMSPVAMRIEEPTGRSGAAVVYSFFAIRVNDQTMPSAGDPFHAPTPMGWQKIVEEAPSSALQAPRTTSQ